MMTKQVGCDSAAIERARAALSHLDPSCDRTTWVKYGMGLKQEFGESGFDVWDAWSAQSEKYSASGTRSAWKSFKQAGKVTIASLFSDAKQAGWKDDATYKKPTREELAAHQAAAAARAAQAALEEAEAHKKAAEWAAALWESATPCESHPYLEHKGVSPYGLRVGRWERIDDETGEVSVVANNALLLPIRDRQRALWGLQAIFVDPKAKKLYLKGCAKAGHFHAIGEPQQRDGRPVFILGEGYATCASVHAATGHLVLVCFDLSNLINVARTIRERSPDAWIVFAADNDTQTEGNPGVTAARKAAAEVGGLVAVPPPGDFNDLYVNLGADAVRSCIDGAEPVPDDSAAFNQVSNLKERMLLDPRVEDVPLPIPVSSSLSPPESDNIESLLAPQSLTQDAVALAFRARFVNRLLFAHSFGCWFKWDGARWRREKTQLAFDFARLLAREMNIEGKNAPASASFCKAVEQFAIADRAFAVEGADFDADNYLLNTPAGTFDLRTNEMRPHDPQDHITKSTSVAPSAEGGEVFTKFLSEITGGDESMSSFLQVSLGACLSGAVEVHWMLFWTGTGRNGKNTLGDLVMDIMGDYAKKVPSSTLMSKQYEQHPTEIANLQGARLAVSSEVEDGAHWNESRINELTGDQQLTARFMRGDFFEFNRTHKHLIFGNHRPQLRNATEALKARIKIVPFKQSFHGREDPELPAKLRHEAHFVLYWLMQGHAAWLAAGRKLPTCVAVEAESQDYFEAQSTVEAWIRERVKIVVDNDRVLRGWPKAGELYKDYRLWKEVRGELPISQSRWGETMAKLFKKQTSDGVRYVGADLLPI